MAQTPRFPPPEALPIETWRDWLTETVARLAALSPEQLIVNTIASVLIIAALGLARTLILRKQPDQSAISFPRRAAVVLAWVAATLAILVIWGFRVDRWLTHPGVIMTHALRIALILLLAGLAWTGVPRVVRFMFIPGQGGGSSRLRTVIPVAFGTLRVFIASLVVLLILAEVGLDITPLLAGAGIVGLAVGFGAQTLVKDFLTGLMILLENSMDLGDAVRIGDHAGTVESMGVRTVRLRDLEGTQHIIPYSEIGTIENMTRGYAYAVFDVGIAYDSNLDAVYRAISDTGERLQADATYTGKILEPITILGLDRFGDNAVIIKARMKTAPQEKWEIVRAFNRLLKERLDADGIEIPHPKRTLHVKGAAPDSPYAQLGDEA